MADEFVELHGDRLFGDDSAIVAGLARMAGRRIVVIGFQKGQDTEENIRRNFGLPTRRLRKAMRVMDLAERFAMRSSPSSTCRAPSPAQPPRSAASPRQSPGRSA